MTRKILLNPGPATTSQAVKNALLVDDICPRENEFGNITKNVSIGLLDIINANNDLFTCILFGGSGTLVMESVITSIPSYNEEILIIENGAYGKRFKDIAKIYNIKYQCLDFKWGNEIDINKLQSILKNNKAIKYVYYTHMETTTGIINNIKSINKIIHKFDCISIIDAMSSFAGVEIDVNKDGIDYLISSSNKCVGGMPGISFVIGKSNYIESLKNNKIISYYSNLYQQYKYFKENFQFRFTPPVQIIYSLNKAIEELKSEGGVKERSNRYTKNYELLKKGIIELGFSIYTKEELESKILITIIEPKNFNFVNVHDKLYKKGITIYPGKLDNNINTFRLSILGDLYKEDIIKFLKSFGEILQNN